MKLFKVTLIVCAVFAIWHFKGQILRLRPGAVSNAHIHGISGYWTMEEEASPRFSLKFLDERQVQMYGDGKVWGPMCTYEISGDDLVLTHACGVWHMEIKGDVLYQEEYGWHFHLTKDDPNGSGDPNVSAHVY